MGGRSAKYYIEKTRETEKAMREKFVLETDEPKKDPESLRQNYSLFHELKAHNISMRKTTDKHDLEDLAIQQKQVLNLARKYNKVLKEITDINEIEFCSARTNALGYVRPFYDESGNIKIRLVLWNRLISDEEKRQEIELRSQVIGKSAKADKDKLDIYTVTHEIGHIIEYSLIERMKNRTASRLTIRENIKNYNDNAVTKIKNEVIKIWEKRYTTGLENDKIQISTYSNENDYEWFAETFSNLELSSEPTPIALALRDYIKENM